MKQSNKKISPEKPTYEFETKVLWTKPQTVTRTVQGEEKQLTNVSLLLDAESLPLKSIKRKLGDKYPIFEKEIRPPQEGQENSVIFMNYTPEFGRKGSAKSVSGGSEASVKFSLDFGKNKAGEDVCYRNVRFIEVFENESESSGDVEL